MIKCNRNGSVWIFAEQEAGQLSDVPLELLGKGRELADKLNVSLGSVLVGQGVENLADKLRAYGSDEVIVLSARPGRIEDCVPVNLPRPRQLAMMATSEFNRLTACIRSRFDINGILHNDKP